MNQEEFEREFGRGESNQRHLAGSINREGKGFCETLRSQLRTFAPITKWLSNYSFRKDFHGDLITGLTVGIMVVPQGMAYTTLVGVAPIYGLYSCLFSAFIYMFFGTSRHISVGLGAFAIASMMVGAVQSDLMAQVEAVNRAANNHSSQSLFEFELTPILITTTLTFFVGICQIVMGLFRLSFLTNYISDPLVSGFTTGAAVHVLFSQLEKVIGVKIARQSGVGTIVKMFTELVRSLPQSNPWELGISAFGIAFLSVGRDYVNPWFKSRFRVPLPIELFLVIMSIAFSHCFELNKAHYVRIVAHVPQGFPVPALPKIELLPYLWQSAITISVICYIFVFSMGKMFAKKHKYKLDSNQELYALGISQIVASLFPVYPSGASLSRSSLCETTGARTQLHALYSSALLLVVILWLAPLLEPLPYAILACIVIVSLKNLFLQFGELPKLWMISKADFLIWLIAFFTTTFVDVTAGLIIGVAVVVLSVVLREQWPKMQRLHANPSQDIFRPAEEYTGLLSPFDLAHRAVVLKFEAPLHFANCAKFVERCDETCAELSATSTTVNAVASDAAPATVISSKNESATVSFDRNMTPTFDYEKRRSSELEDGDMPTLILDAACIAFVDSSGVDALAEVYFCWRNKNLNKTDGFNRKVKEYTKMADSWAFELFLPNLPRCGFFSVVAKSNFYPTVKEAMLSASCQGLPANEKPTRPLAGSVNELASNL